MWEGEGYANRVACDDAVCRKFTNTDQEERKLM